MYPVLSFAFFLYFRPRYKRTSKLRSLFLRTNVSPVQRSKSNRPPAAVMPVRVKNYTTGAGSDSGKKPACVQALLLCEPNGTVRFSSWWDCNQYPYYHPFHEYCVLQCDSVQIGLCLEIRQKNLSTKLHCVVCQNTLLWW